MAKIFCAYTNGNYHVILLEDGTKIRETFDPNATEFIPEFAENCDVKITDKCDGGCPFCYEGCTVEGEHAKLFDRHHYEVWDNGLLSYRVDIQPAQEWLKHLHPGVELAINGNDLSHPDLDPEFPVLLHYLKDQKVVTNITVNQRHFMKHWEVLKDWSDRGLIHGLGVSLANSDDEDFFDTLSEFPNAVVHTIAGVLTSKDICILMDRKCKVLILGYKTLGRGIAYKENVFNHVQDYIKQLQFWLPKMVNECKVVSFDNLAIEQLSVKELLFKGREDRWNEFYMGDDGSHTFYIDAVEEQYSRNSCMPTEERFSSQGKTVDEMFKDIREKYIKKEEKK